MKYKWLGRTGVQVSSLCLGTMSFGGEADEAAAAGMYAACRDAGINFYDCANVYNDGRAEEILGKLIAHERDQLVVTSKCFLPMGDEINARGGSRRHIMMSVEASLKRLGTDRLDVLFMHKWDPNTPQEETLRAFDDLVRAGKVLYLGASNHAAWQIAMGLGRSAANGWSRYQVIQPMYNLVKRQAEVELLPLAREEGLGVMTYAPLGGGLLSGKYGPSQKPDAGRLVESQKYQTRYGDAHVMETAGAFTELAKAHGHHPVSLAVAWAGGHPDVTCPILGARNVDQLMPSLKSVDIDMTPALRAEISALSRTPPLATDRLEEQV